MFGLTLYCDDSRMSAAVAAQEPDVRVRPVGVLVDASGSAIQVTVREPGAGAAAAVVGGAGGELLMAALRAVGVAAEPLAGQPQSSVLTLSLPAQARGHDQVGAVAAAVLRWWRARGDRRLILAAPRAACAGVDRAVEIVERALDRYGAPVYVRKQIVHNQHVVDDLAARGARFVEELDEVPEGAVVVFSAHGVAPAVRVEAARRGLTAVDATCPLVAKVHSEVRQHVRHGRSVIYIGHADHEESEGTLGEVPGALSLVETVEDVATLEVDRPDRVAYVTQTTLALDEVGQIVEALGRRFPGLDGPRGEDICYATTNRQNAVREVAAQADIVVVVGSPTSSNAQRLVEVARRAGTRAVLVEDATELDPALLHGVSRIGITAAASTPEPWVERLIDALGSLGDVDIAEPGLVREDITFTMPAAFRGPRANASAADDDREGQSS